MKLKERKAQATSRANQVFDRGRDLSGRDLSGGGLLGRRASALRTKSSYDGLSRRVINFLCVSLCSLWLSAFPLFAQTYRNPVIAGDFPDPSVIRVGADYYAATTTGGWAPHYPLLHSRDLVNWEIVGAIFSEKPAWAKGDFWAPELATDGGKFYVFYTARRDEGPNKKGTLCVAVATAERPTGPYTDRGPLVCQEMGSIDAFFTRDENGKPFLLWKEDGNDRGQPTWMYAAELDDSLTKLKGKPRRLFRNEGAGWENHVVEGADVVRRDGWFYLFYSGNACCGRSCNYALGVARSRTLLGKWEKYERNPILAENEAWQCPGHGTIVVVPDGRLFLLYHAYRKRADAFAIGREALLDEVKFENGWPVINMGRGASVEASVPFKGTVQKPFAGLFEEFAHNALAPRWNFPLYSRQRATVADGHLAFAPAETVAAANAPEMLVATRVVSGTYTATAKLALDKLEENETAGLSAFGWRAAAVGVSAGAGRVFAWRRETGRETETGALALPAGQKHLHLRLQAEEGEIFRFFASFDEGRTWREIGGRVATGSLEGARVALLYRGADQTPGARFDWLRVE